MRRRFLPPLMRKHRGDLKYQAPSESIAGRYETGTLRQAGARGHRSFTLPYRETWLIDRIPALFAGLTP
jgi:hypothetical protein